MKTDNLEEKCAYYLSSTTTDGKKENPVNCPIRHCNGEKYQLNEDYRIYVCPCYYGDEL